MKEFLSSVILILLALVTVFAKDPSAKTAPAKPAPLSKLDKDLMAAATSGPSPERTTLEVDQKTRGMKEGKIPAATATVASLLEKGANPNAQYADGTTALMMAVQFNQRDAVNALLQKGADINARNQQGLTPLMYAAQMTYQNEEIMKALIAKGADVNAQNHDSGVSILIAAVTSDRPEIVKLLIKHGADVHAKIGDGETALAVAKRYNLTKIIQVLQEAGAKE